MDVKSAFLNGPIKEEVYVEQPPDFESEEYPNHIYKLHKTLYGLNQAPIAWYEYRRDFLVDNDFRIGKGDYTLFTRRMGKDLFVCQIYIDDIIFGSTNKYFYDEFSKIMTNRFEMSMMEVLTFFLGFQIKQVKDGAFISQMKYTCDILKKFGMDNAKPIKTLMGTNSHLDLDMGCTLVDPKVYHSMIASLLYLCASRAVKRIMSHLDLDMPDIMLSVCLCARFQVTPKDCHLRTVKRIMRYIILTHNLGIWYPKGSCFELIGYSDADYARCKVDRKSTSGTCQFLGQSLLSWSSKKQNYVALSMAKAEYIAVGSCCAQLLWMRQTLKDYGNSMNQVPLLCDNDSATKISYNPCEHSRTKYIDIRHHFLRDHAIIGDIVISHVRINDQLADIFTNPLDERRLCEL
jgi:hypothetical protein